MNDNPLEKVIEKKICDHAKKCGCYVRKFTSPAHRSVPDRMIITPHGVVYFMELKRKGEKPTMAQAVEIEKIRQMGVTVYVVDTVQEGITLVDLMMSL